MYTPVHPLVKHDGHSGSRCPCHLLNVSEIQCSQLPQTGEEVLACTEICQKVRRLYLAGGLQFTGAAVLHGHAHLLCLDPTRWPRPHQALAGMQLLRCCALRLRGFGLPAPIMGQGRHSFSAPLLSTSAMSAVR